MIDRQTVAATFRDAKDAPTSFEDQQWLEGFEFARLAIAERLALSLPESERLAFIVECNALGPVSQRCGACGEDHELGEEADATWQQWQCAACGSWEDWSADALEAKARAICEAQPGYGSPAYRGDPMEAVALQQQAERMRAAPRSAA
jgi:hypothetical protein